VQRLAIALLATTYLLCWAPLLQRALRPFREVRLDGVERPTPRPDPSLAGFMSGRFQRQFEDWFDEGLGFRGALVRSENQLNLTLFGELSSRTPSRLVLGRHRQIFERRYLRDQNREQLAPPETIRERARQLRRLQERLAERDIAFLVLTSPSKAAFVADDIPLRLRRAERWTLPRNVDRFVAALARMGVNHFDARAWLAGPGALRGRPVFPSSGTHWSGRQAFRVAGETLRRIEALVGRDLPVLRLQGETATARPRRPDADLARLANVWDTGSLFAPTYHYPRWIPEAASARPVSLLAVGGSFALGPLAFLHAGGAAKPLTFFWYYTKQTDDADPDHLRPLDRRSIDWEREVFSRDVVLIEVNAAEADDAGFGFAADALAHLERDPRGLGGAQETWRRNSESP
jgi:hypothetical protein